MFSFRGCLALAAVLAMIAAGAIIATGLGPALLPGVFGNPAAPGGVGGPGGPGGPAGSSPSPGGGSGAPGGSAAVPSGSASAGPSGSPTGQSPSGVTPGGSFPPVSDRTFSSGQAVVKVTGSFTVDATIPLNLPASVSIDGMLWLQYGTSGAAEPNSLVTRNEDGESGAQAAVGGSTAIGTELECLIDVDVEPSMIQGSFDCRGVTALLADGNLGLVDILVEFVAAS
jgi:hypothetical protein